MDILNRAWTAEEKAELKHLLEEGDRVHTDIEALRESLKDTINAISEKYEIPKKSLRSAVRSYHKRNFEEDKKQLTDVEQIMEITGKTT